LRWQLERFNQLWLTIIDQVPYYTDLFLQKAVPARFNSWDEFLACVPVADRNTVRPNRERMTNKTRPANWWRNTSGSTGQLISLPAWFSENKITDPDVWVGRFWYGVRFSDPCFWIWGHSQLYDSWQKKLNRKVKDLLLGYYRFWTYNFSDERIWRAGDALLKARPRYVRGFSVALDAFARVNQNRAAEFKRLNLKLVEAAGESLPFEDSQALISTVLHAPVALEYGATEAHTLARTSLGTVYRVFWRNYFVEAQEKSPSGYRIVRITGLFPMCFPLIRYDLGDEIELDAQDQSPGYGIAKISKVIGRKDDYLRLKDGSKIHSVVFKHVLKNQPDITGFQLEQKGDAISLNLTTSLPALSQGTRTAIGLRLKRIHPLLSEQVTLHKVDQLLRMPNGKIRLVTRD
jgi:phenylacetate-CoA ligase